MSDLLSSSLGPGVVAVAVLIGGVGLLVGSFLNVVVYRVPNGMSVVSPPSACPGCGGGIKPYDNIPVVSWLVLRGRCRNCREPISFRYPVVEALTGVFFALVAWRFIAPVLAAHTAASLVAELLEAIAFLYLAAISIALAFIDADTRTLPNKIVIPAYVVGVVLLAGAAVLAGHPEHFVTAVAGLGGMFLLYFAMAFSYPRGMGFGDVKLAGVLGLFLGYLGWGPLVVGFFAAFLLGGIYSLILVAVRRATRKSGIPFGPWMLAGAWLGIFFGTTIIDAYLSLFGLGAAL